MQASDTVNANKAHLLAVVLTKNEARHIGACIDSLSPWVDNVIVWDSGSSDGTRAIARDHGAEVVYRPFDNYAAQRQAALDALDAEWILFLDADERLTPALGSELNALVDEAAAGAAGNRLAGCWLPRRNFIAGCETSGGGYFPDYQLRLLRRDAASYVLEREVHEIVELDGSEAFAREPMFHYNYESWQHFHEKQRFYARYEARILAARGIRPRLHNFVLQPLREFRRRFLTLRGFEDGLHGLRLAAYLAWYYGALPYYLLLVDDSIAPSN